MFFKNFKVWETEFAGRKLSVETGKMAGLANASVMVRDGDTNVLCTVTASAKPREGVDFFRSLDIPVRTLECCSGDLADLKVRSLDVEAWSPRQKKYFDVGSCSNLGDAQARRLGIRIKGENGNYFAHTLNNTFVAPPRMLIAFLENNLKEDGSGLIPEPLRMYMGGKDVIK